VALSAPTKVKSIKLTDSRKESVALPLPFSAPMVTSYTPVVSTEPLIKPLVVFSVTPRGSPVAEYTVGVFEATIW
jgi:hypothetical protein